VARPQWRKAYASLYLVMQDMLYGTDVAPDMRHSTWTVVSPSGNTLTRTLEAYTPPQTEPYVFIKRWFSSAPLKGMTAGWRTYPPDHPQSSRCEISMIISAASACPVRAPC